MAATFLARKLDIGQELHLDRNRAIAFADIAAAAGDVEGEVAGAVAAALRLRLRSKELANRIEGLDVRDRIRARRAANGILVDKNDVVEPLGAGELPVETCWVAALGLAERMRDGAIQNLVNQRGFAGAGDAGDADQQAERDLDIDAAE